MEYDNLNLETKREVSTNKSVVYIVITLILVFILSFTYFYYTHVLQRDTRIENFSTITQEDIDTIISREPPSDPNITLRPEQVKAIIKAEANQSKNDPEIFTAEQILKIQQAN